MARRSTRSDQAPAPSGAYSQAIIAGDFMFLSGQGPFDAEGVLIDETFAAEVNRVFDNLAAVAATAGATLADAVRIGVYLSDMALFDEMNEIYASRLPEPRPARTTIETPLDGFKIEVDAVIYLGD